MSFAAIGTSIAGAVVSTGLGYALSPGSPGAPDLVAGNREGVLANAETLAARRAVERAARLGQSTDFETGRTTPHYEDRQFVRQLNLQGLNQPERTDGAVNIGGTGTLVPYNERDWQPGGKFYKLGKDGQPVKPELVTRKTYIDDRPETKHADFTGLGDAQIQAEQADRMAGEILKLRRDLAPGFIEQSRKELQLADPLGQAARARLNELIKADAADPNRGINPLASQLEAQLTDDARAGGGLTGLQEDRLRDAYLKSSLARGGGTDPSQFLDERATADSFARELNRGQQGVNFLASGQTPEDLTYRHNQQVMANQGAFLEGKTPTSQFGQLQNAQQGAVPFQPGAPLPGQNPSAGAFGAAQAAQNYSQSVQNSLNQPNPWYAGLSIALNTAKSAI